MYNIEYILFFNIFKTLIFKNKYWEMKFENYNKYNT